jgi:hypothetical protein
VVQTQITKPAFEPGLTADELPRVWACTQSSGVFGFGGDELLDGFGLALGDDGLGDELGELEVEVGELGVTVGELVGLEVSLSPGLGSVVSVGLGSSVSVGADEVGDVGASLDGSPEVGELSDGLGLGLVDELSPGVGDGSAAVAVADALASRDPVGDAEPLPGELLLAVAVAVARRGDELVAATEPTPLAPPLGWLADLMAPVRRSDGIEEQSGAAAAVVAWTTVRAVAPVLLAPLVALPAATVPDVLAGAVVAVVAEDSDWPSTVEVANAKVTVPTAADVRTSQVLTGANLASVRVVTGTALGPNVPHIRHGAIRLSHLP